MLVFQSTISGILIFPLSATLSISPYLSSWGEKEVEEDNKYLHMYTITYTQTTNCPTNAKKTTRQTQIKSSIYDTNKALREKNHGHTQLGLQSKIYPSVKPTETDILGNKHSYCPSPLTYWPPAVPNCRTPSQSKYDIKIHRKHANLHQLYSVCHEIRLVWPNEPAAHVRLCPFLSLCICVWLGFFPFPLKLHCRVEKRKIQPITDVTATKWMLRDRVWTKNIAQKKHKARAAQESWNKEIVLREIKKSCIWVWVWLQFSLCSVWRIQCLQMFDIGLFTRRRELSRLFSC